MGRVGVIVGLWLIGYAVGFLGYLFVRYTNVFGGLWLALMDIFGNSQIVAAGLVGLATSFIMLAAILSWSYMTKPKI
ncbi:MAG: hypothetical protein JRN22_03845 [Nitrososphaerota archaeon]|jgi:hypothetical protein|nr:hypothetical protein [Nitrososphaerota archaeon]MDG7045134.1 hypothetical protein [Nitrososphaerota archaeon]